MTKERAKEIDELPITQSRYDAADFGQRFVFHLGDGCLTTLFHPVEEGLKFLGSLGLLANSIIVAVNIHRVGMEQFLNSSLFTNVESSVAVSLGMIALGVAMKAARISRKK